MKLITEYVENEIEVVTEANDKGKKSYAIEGIYAQAEAKNRNGRIYPKRVLENAVAKYVTEQVSQGRAVGELNHPNGPTVNLDKVSHKITDLRWEGNNVIGKASILNTPNGLIVQGLLEGGVRLGVSTRGMGSLENRNGQTFVGNDYMLNTIDIVQDPSAHQAFVNGIMEGVEFFYDEKSGLFERSTRMREQMRRMSKKELAEKQMKLFKDFMNQVKSNL